jgi:hypothetical protein
VKSTVGIYGMYIGQAFGRILAFGTSKQKFRILMEVLEEICGELKMKKSDVGWYVPDLSEEEWDEMGSD